MDNMKHRRLQELDRSDFEIVEGEPDIRGWDVKNSHGEKIGEVEELILDAKMKKVRYMVVDMDDNDLKLDHHKVLLPIGLAELHKDDDDVILPGVQIEQLRNLPDYDKDHLDGRYERQICSILGRNPETVNIKEDQEDDPEFYRHDYFNDDNLYKHRLHEAQAGRKESEYEKGLRLWERRSQGGIIAENDSERRTRTESTGGLGREESIREREIEEARMEMVRNRRNNYKQRRYSDTRGSERDRDRERSGRRDHTIEGRIRDEGLREDKE
jgi:sporulation protein YlmC with PRC-barrel domain